MNDVFIDGVGFWAEQMPGWATAAPVLAGVAPLSTERARRPGPQRLAPAERRRAPDTVCLAMQVADEAVAASGHDGAALPCVFASTHGDLPLTDYMCDVVAGDAGVLSPTRFHNSVHNAPAGYWTIASGARQASTALTAFEYTFGAGLLEALVQCAADQQPVLFVAYDVGATGALAEVTRSKGMLAAAVVLAPVRSAGSLHQLQWQTARQAQIPAPVSAAAAALQDNAIAPCLPFFEALAERSCHNDCGTQHIEVAAGLNLALQLTLQAIQ